MSSAARKALPLPPHQRRLINVSKAILSVFVLGSLSVITGVTDVKHFRDEADFAEEIKKQRAGSKPHRCNDRVEDFAKVLFAEDANTFRDFRPAVSMLYRCLRSERGQEPADPYLMLHPSDYHYISPSSRAQHAQAIKEQ